MKKTILPAIFAVAVAIMLCSCGGTSGLSMLNSHRSESSTIDRSAENSAVTETNGRNPEEANVAASGSPDNNAMENASTETIPVPEAQPREQAALLSDIDATPNHRSPNVSTQEISGGQKPGVMNAGTTKEKQKTTPAPKAPNSPPRSGGGVPLWFAVVCCIFLPPLGVALVYGISDKFWICLALTFCFWIPGVIYALFQVLK
jgi:uncharacterized membrane protein YqaE (UPF0057 family)